MIREEKSNQIKKLLAQGNQLASLIPLYPLESFMGEQGNFFFRTITEYDTQKSIIYLFIQKNDGEMVAALAPENILSQIPANIQIQALNAISLIHQDFQLAGSAQTVYEFAKPIFQGPVKIGAVRLGLRQPEIQYISMERISLLAMVAFFIISAMLVSYYGMMLVLKPLTHMSRNIQDACGEIDLLADDVSKSQIVPIVENLEGSLDKITEKLGLIEQDNIKLASKLGLANFEKNQVFKILDAISFGIIITDIQDNIGHINQYLLKLLRKKTEEVIDKPFSEVLDNEDIRSFLLRYDELEQAGAMAHIDTTFPELAPNEVYRVSSSYLLDDEKAPIGKMFTFTNITAARLAENAKQEFIAHVAHELMTPLTNIRSYSEMLMDGEIDDPEMQKEFYNTINEQTGRLSNLIKNLLNISKMEMGSLTIEKGLVRTDWFVEDCLSSIEASARDKNISIERNLPDTFPSLLADKDLLKAAVINILGNAVKYTPEKGKISFGISEQDKMVTFDVIDTGYGIAEDELSKIFEKFFRSENPQVTEQVGSGLGLAITSEIVRLHGGDITVESQLGKGTHFAIKIPKEEYSLE